jgi:hypothetical protein
MDTITLKYPIDFEGGKLSEITIRRPKVSDVTTARKSKKDEAEQEVALIAALSGLPPSAIDELDIADYKAVQEVLQGFFG